jgi:hypothetical protein
MENQERLIKYGHTRHRTKANKTPKNTTYHGKLKRSVTQTNQKPAVCFVVISIYIMVQSSALFFSECTTGTYGVNCEFRCDACVDKMCESRNGNYTYGCIEGYKGVRCKLSGILRLAPG